MEDKILIAQEILAKYGQEHILKFYNEFSKEEQN